MHPRVNKSKISQPKKFKLWIKKHWISVTIISAATILASLFVYSILSIKYEESSVVINKQAKPAQKFYSNLSGIEVPEESNIKKPVTGVMIENSPEARPQSGLKQAEVVYEAVAEGGITRFLALYQQNKPELIGPVRSLRMYYLDWAAPYQASIAHVGGSQNALAEVRNGSYRDIDQYSHADTYWRATDRYAPHNMYTNFERIDSLNNSKGYGQSEFASFSRTGGKPVETPDATSISIDFSSHLYNTNYTYDASSNTYFRNMGGETHNDREHGQLTPSVIVALRVNTQAREGSDNYQDIVTNGTGQAFVFQNGTVQEVTWRKQNRTSPLEIIDQDGSKIALNRGQTWIGAVTGTGGISWQ